MFFGIRDPGWEKIRIRNIATHSVKPDRSSTVARSVKPGPALWPIVQNQILHGATQRRIFFF
jgi:hypothetical protein